MNLVIDFLENKVAKLSKKIREERGSNVEDIELKKQLISAIENLKLCVDYDLQANRLEIIKIPEGGSDSFYTAFNIVDEAAIEYVPEWAIKKHEEEIIKLDSFDLIFRKK